MPEDSALPHPIGYAVERWSPIDTRHRITGGCRHLLGSARAEIPVPDFVAIVDEGEGFYLFRLDSEWNVLADTWHESLDSALRQAEFEYEGVSKTWQAPEN